MCVYIRDGSGQVIQQSDVGWQHGFVLRLMAGRRCTICNVLITFTIAGCFNMSTIHNFSEIFADIYRVIQEERTIFWRIVSVIIRKIKYEHVYNSERLWRERERERERESALNIQTVRFYLFLDINQLDELNFIISLFQASTCFEHTCSSSGGQNYIIQSPISSHL